MTHRLRRSCCLASLLVASAVGLEAQLRVPPIDARALPSLGSVAEDRWRLAQLGGDAPASGFLIRSTSTLMAPADSTVRFAIGPILPEAGLVWNSALPFGGNDGALWAGRGLNSYLRAGVWAKLGPLEVIVAPERISQDNDPFQTIAYRDTDRSRYASPWYEGDVGIDLPSRPGTEAQHEVGPGQSSITLRLGAAAIGVATENLWWGPAARNAVVMSNNAPGFRHLFLRTARPVATPLGQVEGRWILGELDESRYFDFSAENDRRSLSGLALTLQPGFDPGLTLGVTRVVSALSRGDNPALDAAFDVFQSVPPTLGLSAKDTISAPEQIFSFFARWVLPRAGVEAYAEWARTEQPGSVRDLLVRPSRSQGYTLGLQWATSIATESRLRLQTEVTYLEPDPSILKQPVTPFYAGRGLAQGYTHRGQVLGASTGPASSSQWAAADFVRPRWQLGVFGGRIRWDNAAFYAVRPRPPFFAHDVSLYSGVRGSLAVGGFDVAAEWAGGIRLNYLYQNAGTSFDDMQGVDVRNRTLRLVVSPRGRL